jgi:type II secretory pathway pseudopilin PulG
MNTVPKSSPGRPSRSGAIISIVLVVAAICGLGAISIRTLLQDRRDANERTAMQTILQVNTALYRYRQAHADAYPKSLNGLPEVELPMKCGEPECLKSGYRFKYELLPPTSMGPRYVIQVRPNKYQNTGVQSFYSDESGVIRGTKEDRPASAGDGPVS